MVGISCSQIVMIGRIAKCIFNFSVKSFSFTSLRQLHLENGEQIHTNKRKDRKGKYLVAGRRHDIGVKHAKQQHKKISHLSRVDKKT